MRLVVQRVTRASVRFEDKKEEISKGLVIFVGIGVKDNEEKIKQLAKKVVNLRIFENENKKMDKSILDIGGEILIVSEFTLYGDCFQGNRPDFTEAAKPDLAENLYNKFVEELKKYVKEEKIKTGRFRSYMLVEIYNDGPVTFILEN